MQKSGDISDDSKKTLLGLVAVMEWSLFLALGTLSALIGSVKEFFEDHTLRFNLWTILAPVIVLTLNHLFWRHVKRRIHQEEMRRSQPGARR